MTIAADRTDRRGLRGPLLTAGAVGAAFAVVGLVDPHEPGHYPVCPMRTIFGVYCPFCGGLRAANDLVHGQVSAAAGSNLLFVVALPFIALAWGLWLRDRARGSDRDLFRFSTRQLWLGAAVLVVFTVVRNLPWGTALAP